MAEPRSFGRYCMTATIGAGAMDAVFAGIDEALGRAAAASVASGSRRGPHGELLA